MVKYVTAILWFLAAAAHAEQSPTEWNLEQGKSSITFIATQNNAPVKGRFLKFSAPVLTFHPDALAQSHVKIEVAMSELEAAYGEVVTTLKQPDWFASDAHPKAVFETKRFEALGENTYRAESTLTIKGIAVPVVLDFTLQTFSDSHAHVTGRAQLQRLDYKIGWEDTSSVENSVTVEIDIRANAAH